MEWGEVNRGILIAYLAEDSGETKNARTKKLGIIFDELDFLWCVV